MKHKNIIKTAGAVLSGLLIVNLLSAGIYTLPAKYSVVGKATPEVWESNAPVILGTEGYAYNHTDQNGYNNPDGITDGRYALALGSSHTQGFNVSRKENYCSLYNEYAKVQQKPLLYNAGMDANNFADIVKHFPAAVTQFADAEYFVIETPYFNFTEAALTDALQTVEYRESTPKTFPQKIYGFIQSMPLARLLVRQWMETDKSEFDKAFFQATANREITEVVSIDYYRYKALLEQCFASLRDGTDKPIVLIYHCEPEMSENGVSFPYESIENHAVLPLINALCETYDITLIDPTEVYMENYAKNHTLPYGFSNTVYGEGHLNAVGHELIASLLIDADKEANR